MCEKAPPLPTKHYLSMAYSLPRPGGLGKINRWGWGASVVKKLLTSQGEICSIESPGVLGLKFRKKRLAIKKGKKINQNE